MNTRHRLAVLLLAGVALVAGCCPFRCRIEAPRPEGPSAAAHGGIEIRWAPPPDVRSKPASPSAAPAPAAPKAPIAPLSGVRKQTFDAVWQTIRDNHYGPEKLGVDWDAVRVTYAPKAAAAEDAMAFYAVLNGMLGELKQSHCMAAPPAEARHRKNRKKEEDSVASMSPEDLAAAMSGQIGDPGIEIRAVEGSACIVTVVPDSPAAKAGIRPGSILKSVDGEAVPPIPVTDRYFDLVEWTFEVAGGLYGSAGTKVTLGVAAKPCDPPTDFQVSRIPVASASMGHLGPIPAPFADRLLDGGFLYIRFGSFFVPVFEQYQKVIKKHRAAAGLILDLRGNPGGLGVLATGVAGFLIKERIELGTSQMKAGDIRFPVFPRPKPFTGPMAILIDETSASTSEILAAGMQEAHRARVFGHTSAGAVLPSLVIELPDGGRLQFPTADFKTPGGVTLEGRGAIPDEEVWWTLEACRAGRDPVLEAAIRWIQTQVSK